MQSGTMQMQPVPIPGGPMQVPMNRGFNPYQNQGGDLPSGVVPPEKFKDPQNCEPWKYVERHPGCVNAPQTYLAYASPLQYQGFQCSTSVANPFEKEAAIDFRYEDFDFPYGSRALASKGSSAHRPTLVEPLLVRDNCAVMPQYPPWFRYPGLVHDPKNYGSLGIALENFRPGDNNMHRPPNMIVGLEDNGVAERAGAQVGDVICEINRKPVGMDSGPAMREASVAYERGIPLNFKILRGNQIEHFYCTPPQHRRPPPGLGKMAGPNPPDCFPEVLQQWYDKPAKAGEVLEHIS